MEQELKCNACQHCFVREWNDVIEYDGKMRDFPNRELQCRRYPADRKGWPVALGRCGEFKEVT